MTIETKMKKSRSKQKIIQKNSKTFDGNGAFRALAICAKCEILAFPGGLEPPACRLGALKFTRNSLRFGRTVFVRFWADFPLFSGVFRTNSLLTYY